MAVVDFDQLVRIFVDTDVDTHFIVSLARSATVAELRELVKVTHRHCYPDGGDVEVGKLAVPGGEYGYQLADFLLIGQVYDRYEGKVLAEVKNHDPASTSSQGLSRMPALSFKTSSTHKKAPMFAPQTFEAILSEPGALFAVGPNPKLIVPKLQKEEIDQDCALGSQEPPGCLTIVEDEGAKLVERPGACEVQGMNRKRGASECDERSSKSRRLTEQGPLENGRIEDRDGAVEKSKDESSNVENMKVVDAAATSLSHVNRSNASSGSRGRKETAVFQICDRTTSEGVNGGMLEVEEKARHGVNDFVIGSGGDGGTGGLGVIIEDRLLSLPEDPVVLAALEQLGKKRRKLRQAKEPELEKRPEVEEGMTEKKRKNKKKEKKPKHKEPEPEMQPKEQKEPEEEKVAEEGKEPDEVQEMMVTRKDKKNNEKRESKPKNQKRKVLEEEKMLEEEEVPEEEKVEKKKKKLKEEKKQKKEKMQRRIIDEITPLDGPSLNPLLEASDKEPQREDECPDLSQHTVNDEKDGDDGGDDVPDSKKGVGNKGSSVAAAVVYNSRSRTSIEDSGRSSAREFLRDEVSESGTPQREVQVSQDSSGDDAISEDPVAKESGNLDGRMYRSKLNLFGDSEIRPSYHGGTETSPPTQDTKIGSAESPESLNPLKHPSADRGASSQARSMERSRDMTKDKQMGGRNSKANESQSSQCSEKATPQSVGINLGSEVSGAWFRRGMLDQSQVAQPGEVARSRSSSGESSAESDLRVADQTDVSKKEDHLDKNHALKSPAKHASRSVGGEVNKKNDSLEFFSQDQSFHVAPTQVAKALSGSSTDESSDESDDDDVKKQPEGNIGITRKGGGESEASSDERGELATPARVGFPPLTSRTPLPSVSRMTANGGSQSFKRRASGVAAEIEAKFAQFIESQGGLDEIMGITLGQRKRSLPVESSTQGGAPGARSTGSLATPFGSPLDIALNTQESVKNSPSAVDIAQASQHSAGKYFTPPFKVPKPVSLGTAPGGGQGALNSAATVAGGEVSKSRAVKELRLKRKESTLPVEKTNEAVGFGSSKETFLNEGAAERRSRLAGNASFLSPRKPAQGTFLDDLNAADVSKSSPATSSEKKKRLEDKYQDSQFMVVNNTDHISEHEKLGSAEEMNGPPEDGSFGKTSKELKVESVETGVVGSPSIFVPDSSEGQKKRKNSEKEGARTKRMKFLVEELNGREVTVLPENSVERSARETEELYFKLEKANRDLWLQNNSVSSFRKGEEKMGNRTADLEDIEGVEGEDAAQSRLVAEEQQLGDSGHENLKVVDQSPAPRHPSPEICAGTTEASDREGSVFQSQAEASQQDKPKATDVFDYVSGDELPTKVFSKSVKKIETNETKKAKRMDELSRRAVQRVLEDEMFQVVDATDTPGKKSRKGAKPVKWTVRMRALSPGTLAPSLHGGSVPFDAAAEFRALPSTVSKPAAGGAQEKRQGAAAATPRRVARTPQASAPKQTGGLLCPMGCGRPYTKKTSAYYLHKQTCTGAPLQ